jgi:hypothetical protein
MPETASSRYPWRFFRSGGFDQVAIERPDDLRHLDALDLKLWTALTCPSTGLEFDPKTLALVDADGDGLIRAPELLAAVRWACAQVKDPQVLFEPPGLPLAAIDDATPEGATLRSAAEQALALLGKPGATALVADDFADMTKLFTPGQANGDGVVPAALAATAAPELALLVEDIIATQPTPADRSGEPGACEATLAAFFEQAQALGEWRAQVAPGAEGAAASAETVLPLGEAATAAAADAVAAVAGKVDDFFTRCRLAAFDARAAEPLNPPATAYQALAEHTIAADDAAVGALPLATVAAGAALPLQAGLNPVWAARVQALARDAVAPLLGARESLTADDWAALQGKLTAHAAWQAARPATKLHALEPARLAQHLVPGRREALAALIAADAGAAASAAQFDALQRLAHYQRDLVTLLRNFVTLSDFYGGQRKAVFQAGTLYIDQRSCELVLRVPDMGRHAGMAPFSGCYLVYCQCERSGEAPLTIAAALTGGSVDELMVAGRHGLFIDRQGRDWKATVVKVVEQPVSLRQAFWSPYRRVGRFIEDQIRNFASAKDKAVEAQAQAGVTGAAAKAAEGAPPAAPAFDIARFAGIFAALGLAVGAIGAALTAALSGLFQLAAWQLPLVLAAVMLAISAPSLVLAWLTLRRRNLGPLLDANGWAVNARARINIPFGAALTGVAALPPGASRTLVDPYAEQASPWPLWLLIGVVVLAALAAWRSGVFG